MNKFLRFIVMRLAREFARILKEILEDLMDNENGDDEKTIIAKRTELDKKLRDVA